MFISYFADDLLNQVLYRYESIGAAIFIDHEGKMDPAGLHPHQKIQRRHCGGNKQQVAFQFGDGNLRPAHLAIRCSFNQTDHIFDVNHTERIIESFTIQRQPGMLCLAEYADQLRKRNLFFYGNDVSPGHHHIGNRHSAEVQQVRQHQALLRT